MTTTLTGVNISPVNIEERKNLGIKAGDTVRVHQKIEDKGKVRIQVFEGTVLARKHGNEPGATFTVRKVSSGIGIEKIYPLYSPNIDKIEIVRRAKVRRAKLYYIREKVAREIKRQMRRMSMVALGTKSEIEQAAEADAAAKQAEEEAKAAEEAAQKAEEEAKAKEAEAAKAPADAEAEVKDESGSTDEKDTPEEKPAEEVKQEEAPAEEETKEAETTEEAKSEESSETDEEEKKS